MSLERHTALMAVRAIPYAGLFGCTPSAVFPHHVLFNNRTSGF